MKQLITELHREVAELRDEVQAMRPGTSSTATPGGDRSTPQSPAITQIGHDLVHTASRLVEVDDGGWRQREVAQDNARWQQAWLLGGRWFTTGEQGGTLLWCKCGDGHCWAHVSGPADPFGTAIRGQNEHERRRTREHREQWG